MTTLEPGTVAGYDQDERIDEFTEDSYAELICPLDGCTGRLYIEHSTCTVLSAGMTIADLISLEGNTETWHIGCTEGHKLLLPVSHADDYERFMHECTSCAPDRGESNEPVYHDDIGRLRALIGR